MRATKEKPGAPPATTTHRGYPYSVSAETETVPTHGRAIDLRSVTDASMAIAELLQWIGEPVTSSKLDRLEITNRTVAAMSVVTDEGLGDGKLAAFLGISDSRFADLKRHFRAIMKRTEGGPQ